MKTKQERILDEIRKRELPYFAWEINCRPVEVWYDEPYPVIDGIEQSETECPSGQISVIDNT